MSPVKEKLAISNLGASFLDLAGTKKLQNEKTASNELIKAYNGWVYANVSAIAEVISQIEPELYKVSFAKGEMVNERIMQHPLLDLLDKINEINTSSEAFFLIAANLELVGDCFLLKDLPVKPTEFYILDPTCIEVVPADDGFRVNKYIYKRIINGKKVEKIYRPEQIIHMKTPNPENPLRGKSTVAAASLPIDITNLAFEFEKSFFKNGAVISFALTTEQRVTEDQIKSITAQLKREYGSVTNAFKMLILGGGFGVTPVQQSNKEMTILELLDHMRDTIMAMFKNTKASLGITTDVNRANAEASLMSWKASVIKPKMTRIMDALNEYLVPDYGDDLVLSFKDPTPENRPDKIAEATGLSGKVITVNEARTLLGYPALQDPNFDTLISEQERMQQQQDLAKAGAAGNNPKTEPKPKSLDNVSYERHLRRLGVYRRYERYKKLWDAARAVVVAKTTPKPKKATKAAPAPTEPQRYASYTNTAAQAYWEKQVGSMAEAERQFARRLEQFLQGIEDKAISALHGQQTKDKTLPAGITKATLINEDEEVSAGVNLFTPLLEDMALLSGTAAYELLGLDKVYSPTRRIHEVIHEYVSLMTNSAVETDAGKLEAILTDGLDNGHSIPEIESAIRREFGDFRRNQAEKIARTETLRASNAGALDAYKESDVVTALQWFTAEDDRVDEECAALDGKVIGFGKSFFDADYGSGEQPPLHPNCRCTLLPVVDDHVIDEK